MGRKNMAIIIGIVIIVFAAILLVSYSTTSAELMKAKKEIVMLKGTILQKDLDMKILDDRLAAKQSELDNSAQELSTARTQLDAVTKALDETKKELNSLKGIAA